ncbi:thiol reductant ABC exporter subunit CydD [Cumulibacter manganitolerans]|uniref:thiol reductant ABC exporter subunit CydD n=1 Tax=Cumulibacter manganitolerans TaxID=1884992 RepID=UPI0012952F22|nr:thiol reductant ABC exporter subunit CydD [Cumulibacter manganitolerans]
MKPLDPRLLRHAAATRALLGGAVVVGVGTAVATIGYSATLAHLIAAAIRHGTPVAQLTGATALLGLWVAARVLFAWAGELFPRRLAVALTGQLRRALLDRVVTEDRGVAVRRSPSSLITLATTGVAGLESYAARYLPQLVIAAVVPAGVVAYVGWIDLPSAIVAIVTLPLIPLFMALIGLYTQQRTRRQLRRLEVLAHRFVDVVTGLATLKAYGRGRAQGELIAQADRRHKQATMQTLRIAFLSSFALELLATLSVALVAVTIGLRLAAGTVELEPALTVLLVIPEAYLALRAVGTHFHSSVDGLTAAERIFAILDEPVPARGDRPLPRRAPELTLRGVRVGFGADRDDVALPDLTAPAAEVTLLRGPSGAGKTTALNVLAGLLAPSAGDVRIDGVALSAVAEDELARSVAYVGQAPHLLAGSIADNVRALAPGASDGEVDRALYAACLDQVVDALPAGAATVLGDGAADWSQGQRQRLAIARAIAADAPVLLLDEPTSALDEATERELLHRVSSMLDGRTVVIASHREQVAAYADHIVEVGTVDA